jgi:hypothetical protein
VNLEELRRLAELLPEGGSVVLPRAAILEATAGAALPLTPAAPAGEPMLTADEVAVRLQTSKRWVYQHQGKLGGQRLSPRTLRFPASAVERFATRSRRAA